MGRISKMEYPHGWVEDYHYDSIGQLLKVEDTDPTQKDMKQQKHVYEYDACGNMTYEYMRGNGTGEATVENTYTYDALHRVISVHENYGNDNRSYTYDSLGNLTYETAQGNKSVDYKLNNLNQITSSSDDGWKTSTTYTYDKRGNLVQELYTKNNKQSVTGAYTYDETNKMVQGVNDIGESSEYLYNGLGALVTNTWTIKKNAYGYHDVQLSAVVEGETVVDADSGKKAKKEKKTAEEVAASPELNKTSTVVKEFVVDYTTETYESLMEHEVGGLDYRYVYGNDRLSVNITGVENGSSKLIENGNQIRLYYHMDYLGTADYLTSPLTGKVESWTHYNEWGEITHNAVLKCGQRELDMVKRYATHDYDQVLGMYYAKARFYDAENRRFVAVDPILDPSVYDIKGYANNPTQLVQYLYVSNNPIVYIDPLGLMNYFTQTDNLLSGVWQGVKDNTVGLIQSVPQAIPMLKELVKGVVSGDINIVDLAKAVLKGALGDYWHVVRYADTLDPFVKKSDSEVYRYGRAVGSVATDIVLSLVGATVVDKAFDILKSSKVGQKIISLANQAKGYFDDFICQNKQTLANTLYEILDDSSDVAKAAARRRSFSGGKAGETFLKEMFGGKSQAYFNTSQGARFVDQLVGRTAHESKVGYVSATDFIRKQAAKDAELLATKQVNEVVWHFFRSADTGKIGPSAPLKKLLEGYGIKVIVYN